ncbi:hypothetical protein COCNU_01G017030 [Cocos nucifera]|uniref:Uncharacterized protein n=1 Tax=Cocos nucifera TaxID=13894 RepID=A0A8K0HX39_COCNU|nr:hypothetical protein COCNU_01G017030 [Cocos nucifera]
MKKEKGKETVGSTLASSQFVSPSNAASYFRLFIEHIEWLDENKKSLEEALQSMRDCQKVVKEKAAKEKKLATGLKKQLQEKLNEIMEKNKALLDLQRKANEEEEKLLELR